MIGISNKINLPEELMPRVASRLGSIPALCSSQSFSMSRLFHSNRLDAHCLRDLQCGEHSHHRRSEVCNSFRCLVSCIRFASFCHVLLFVYLFRLAGLNVFDVDTVELVSRKVASVSGDVRRALQICRSVCLCD